MISRNFHCESSANGPIENKDQKIRFFDPYDSSSDKQTEDDVNLESSVTEVDLQDTIQKDESKNDIVVNQSEPRLPLTKGIGLRERKHVIHTELHDPGYSLRGKKINPKQASDLHAGYIEIVNISRDILCGFAACDLQVPDRID